MGLKVLMMLPTGAMKANKGFSLIEIILVLIIAGIILAISVPNFSKQYSRFQLTQAVDDWLSISRWAQAMAIGQQRIYSISFSKDHRSYCLMREKLNKNNENLVDVESVNGLLGRKHFLAKALKLNVSVDQVKFYPDASIDPIEIQFISDQGKSVVSSSKLRGMMMECAR